LEKDPGKQAEETFELAARILIKRNPFFTEYVRVSRILEFDSRQIDGVLCMRCSLALLVQVKSSDDWVRKHYEGRINGGKFKPGRPCVVAFAVLEDADPEKLSHEIERAALESLESPDQTPYERYLKQKKPQ